MFDEKITTELKKFNAELTVVGTLFAILSAISAWGSFYFFLFLDHFLIENGSYSIGVLNTETMFTEVMRIGYNSIYYFIGALAIWCILNQIQMICLAIDQWRNRQHV